MTKKFQFFQKEHLFNIHLLSSLFVQLEDAADDHVSKKDYFPT
jgi:hypothetical protein